MMADVGENSNKAALSGLLCRWVGGALRPAAGGIHPPPLLPVFVHHPPSSPPSPTSSLSTSQPFTLPARHQGEPQPLHHHLVHCCTRFSVDMMLKLAMINAESQR